MPFQLIRDDLTRVACDAMVNATDTVLSGDGGVDGAIQRAGGPELRQACRELGGCRPGEVKVTAGYSLPCRYILHTAVPVWQGGGCLEPELLASSYREAFRMAEELGCEKIALPLLGAGAGGFPGEQALAIAEQEIRRYLDRHEGTVVLTLFDRAAVRLGQERYASLQSYIDDTYAEEHYPDRERRRRWEREHIRPMPRIEAAPMPDGERKEKRLFAPIKKPRPSGRKGKTGEHPAFGAVASAPCEEALPVPEAPALSLEEAVAQLDESFSQMLLRKIDEKGMTDAACYKRANVDRKLFSKIRNNIHYRPSKATALAFAVALELSLPETEELLRKAGYALSHSSIFDIIVEYHIKLGDYNIFTINEALFAYDQSLLGAG